MYLHLADCASVRSRQDHVPQSAGHFYQLQLHFYIKTELLSLTLLWPRWSVITSSQREKRGMQGDRETKDSPAAVIGLLFFCQFLKSLGTSLSFLLSLLPSPLFPLSLPSLLPLLFLSIPSSPSVSLLCAKNIFIILLCCPHSAVPQHTNDSVCLRVCVPVCASETVSMCFYLCVCWRKCLWV